MFVPHPSHLLTWAKQATVTLVAGILEQLYIENDLAIDLVRLEQRISKALVSNKIQIGITVPRRSQVELDRLRQDKNNVRSRRCQGYLPKAGESEAERLVRLAANNEKFNQRDFIRDHGLAKEFGMYTHHLSMVFLVTDTAQARVIKRSTTVLLR